ncbi:hypothetical protein NDU88_008607 [Pleurodeles waltl]|uniref:Uncharacterized protein n=1 Tax=Pleurodeles waltl TaxID=8319 RepID=A0AAV7RW80_PLEWA|nr:hypothetical protein NDU88_008607 [Pleurodeles waltl]
MMWVAASPVDIQQAVWEGVSPLGFPALHQWISKWEGGRNQRIQAGSQANADSARPLTRMSSEAGNTGSRGPGPQCRPRLRATGIPGVSWNSSHGRLPKMQCSDTADLQGVK